MTEALRRLVELRDLYVSDRVPDLWHFPAWDSARSALLTPPSPPGEAEGRDFERMARLRYEAAHEDDSGRVAWQDTVERVRHLYRSEVAEFVNGSAVDSRSGSPAIDAGGEEGWHIDWRTEYENMVSLDCETRQKLRERLAKMLGVEAHPVGPENLSGTLLDRIESSLAARHAATSRRPPAAPPWARDVTLAAIILLALLLDFILGCALGRVLRGLDRPFR